MGVFGLWDNFFNFFLLIIILLVLVVCLYKLFDCYKDFFIFKNIFYMYVVYLNLKVMDCNFIVRIESFV